MTFDPFQLESPYDFNQFFEEQQQVEQAVLGEPFLRLLECADCRPHLACLRFSDPEIYRERAVDRPRPDGPTSSGDGFR